MCSAGNLDIGTSHPTESTESLYRVCTRITPIFVMKARGAGALNPWCMAVSTLLRPTVVSTALPPSLLSHMEAVQVAARPQVACVRVERTDKKRPPREKRSAKRAPGRIASHHLPRLARVFAHIDAHLDASLRVAELAGVACLSTAQFTRVFKAATGRSPHQFVLDCRVAAACKLIESGMGLARVAAEVGFASQSHMTDVFRCRLGRSPGAVAEAS